MKTHWSRLGRQLSEEFVSHPEQKPFVPEALGFCSVAQAEPMERAAGFHAASERLSPRQRPGVSPPKLLPLLLFSFSSSEPCHPGSSAEAVKEDGKPSYRRMITIINIHGWFTYHSWLHRHGSRYETSTGVARWYILHCATMDLCIL